MNETTVKFKYLWRANFRKKVITQHPQDLYSKHDPKAEYNPSSFRDFQNYFDEHKSELDMFGLWSDKGCYLVDFTKDGYPIIKMIEKGKHWSGDKEIILHREKRELKDIRVIYFRNMEVQATNGVFSEPRVLSYTLGYQGIDKNGNNRQKTIVVV